MTNAPVLQSQPRGVAALAHYVDMRTKQPMRDLGGSVHSIHLGTEYAAEINFFDIADAVNSHASLKARAEQAERSVDVLESNARVQAKLLADTGRRAEELEGRLRMQIETFDEACKRIDVLEEALRPFAEIAPFVEFTDFRDGNIVHRQYDREGRRHELRKDHFRKAAKALPQSSSVARATT